MKTAAVMKGLYICDIDDIIRKISRTAKVWHNEDALSRTAEFFLKHTILSRTAKYVRRYEFIVVCVNRWRK